LDGTQTASLATLPFAGDLETVASSPALPTSVLSTVGSSLAAADINRLTAGLLKMTDTPEGSAALEAVRLARFIPLDDKALAAARKAYGGSASTPK
jgi:ABC-type phosphate/phosphonate transport system substrate-binding protein